MPFLESAHSICTSLRRKPMHIGQLKPGDYVILPAAHMPYSLRHNSPETDVGYVEAVDPSPSGGWDVRIIRHSSRRGRWGISSLKCTIGPDGSSNDILGRFHAQLPIDLNEIHRRRERALERATKPDQRKHGRVGPGWKRDRYIVIDDDERRFSKYVPVSSSHSTLDRALAQARGSGTLTILLLKGGSSYPFGKGQHIPRDLLQHMLAEGAWMRMDLPQW